VSILAQGQELRLKDLFNVGGSLAGNYQASLQVLEGSPAAAIANAAANFSILLDEPGVGGVIQANPRVFLPGQIVNLSYRIQNTANGPISGQFSLRIIGPDGAPALPNIDLGQMTLAQAEIKTGTQPMNSAGFKPGTYTAYLEFGGGAWVLDFDIAEAQVTNIEVADIETTINNIPGYSAQQSTVQTQGAFTLLIGILDRKSVV